ncbi:MAG: T9SS type A sorting domain-containing protein [Parafilimonas sp.]|nr:T9SS type A sorting domain-containing protein [Parafilimonas sp.]
MLKSSQPLPAIYTNLMEAQSNGLFLADGVGVGFGSQYSPAVDNDDAAKLWNFDENIAIIRNTQPLAIEFRPLPVLTDSFFYCLYLRQQPYALKIVAQNFTGLSMHAWLIDKYLHTKTSINLTDGTIYNFTPNSDTNSYRNRFMLVLNRQLNANSMQVTKPISQNNLNQTDFANSVAFMQGSTSLYPNPVMGTTPMLRFKNMTKGSYIIAVYNANNQKLKEYTISHSGGNAAYALEVDRLWTSGIYTIRIYSDKPEDIITLRMQLVR